MRSLLLELRIGGFGLPAGEDLGVTSVPETVTDTRAVEITARQQEWIFEARGVLGRLRKRGIVEKPGNRGENTRCGSPSP